MFNDDWTPAHLTAGPSNLYKEIALALKGVEWRTPSLVAIASKLAASAAPHVPIEFTVPDTYEPKVGPNKWSAPSELKKEGHPKYDTNVSDRAPGALTPKLTPKLGENLLA